MSPAFANIAAVEADLEGSNFPAYMHTVDACKDRLHTLLLRSQRKAEQLYGPQPKAELVEDGGRVHYKGNGHISSLTISLSELSGLISDLEGSLTPLFDV
jgi:hypothetical protein